MKCVLDGHGPLHTVFTVTGKPTAFLNSMMQVRVREEPVKMVPEGEAITVTAIARRYNHACTTTIIINESTAVHNPRHSIRHYIYT